jgi:long-chain acyl-CoA synthetase
MILEDLQLIKPTILFAVPTLYKKIYDGVHNLMESATPFRKRLMKNALELGRRNVDAKNGVGPPLDFIGNMQFKALDSIVLSKIRARFGGNLRHGFVAGAACPAEVLSFMDSIGVPVCEGYGLTETSPIISINTPEQRQIGSIGRAIGGVTVYIMDEQGHEVADGEEGEICCVGPNVMRGYHENKEATDAVISVAPDGNLRMFHTGDLGRRDETGFLKVTGRLKEQYKLENGKYICPTPIEEAIGMSRFISQVVLCGANREFNVVLLVPEWPSIRNKLGVAESVSEEELANDERVKELIDSEIISSCGRIKKYEIPQQWAFVAPFTVVNDMLTPKMSIRRHKVIHTYADVISHMYGDDPIVSEAADAKGAKEHPGEAA